MSISLPTCTACNRLTTRATAHVRRPSIALATNKVSRRTFRPSLQAIRRRLRGLFILDSLNDSTSQRPRTVSRDAGTKKELLAQSFQHPHGTGFIGPGADALLRTMLTEALTHEADVAQVITTKADLARLLSPLPAEPVIESQAPRLHVNETLEDAVEYLEHEAEMTTMINTTSEPPTDPPAIVWLAAPGPDADVVHETLQRWPANSLIALMSGHWPYGPTHLIEETGPRPLPSQPIPLLSAKQAITLMSDIARYSGR